MVCINCGGKTQVTNSRLKQRSNQVWRRRLCLSCGTAFTTEETAAYSSAWVVKGPEGRFQPFVSAKLLLSLHRSLQHRQTALNDAVGLSNTVINKLPALAQDGLLDRQDIIRAAQVALNRYDKVASSHYAAYHRR